MSKTATPKNVAKALASNDSTLENEAGDFYVDIDSLQAHGVNMADLKKLKAVGICTTRGLKMITKKKLCNIKGNYGAHFKYGTAARQIFFFRETELKKIANYIKVKNFPSN